MTDVGSTITSTAQALIDIGFSKAFAYMLLNGKRRTTPAVALWLRDRHAITLPQLDGVSDDGLEALRVMYPPAPPQPRKKAA